MMQLNRLRVSLVIPVYNEESHLRGCLDAIAAQTVQPLEVIVVDNNSNDGTAAIAAAYPFVTLITIARQGVVYARDAGFDAAKGEIIGRIDADTHIAPDWLARRMGNVFLWGANMGLRSSVWRAVRSTMCHEGRFHEDLDLAAHLGLSGHHVTYDIALRADVSGRRIDTNPFSFWRYVRLNAVTYARHDLTERWFMYPVYTFVLMHYVPLRILYRGFNSRTRRFSWLSVFVPHTASRVDPAVFKV
jgi:glycosyltransferase involved in cell wall biosynthesis